MYGTARNNVFSRRLRGAFVDKTYRDSVIWEQCPTVEGIQQATKKYGRLNQLCWLGVLVGAITMAWSLRLGSPYAFALGAGALVVSMYFGSNMERNWNICNDSLNVVDGDIQELAERIGLEATKFARMPARIIQASAMLELKNMIKDLHELRSSWAALKRENLPPTISEFLENNLPEQFEVEGREINRHFELMTLFGLAEHGTLEAIREEALLELSKEGEPS